MALTPEDGTGLANADSYGSVADVTAYLTDYLVDVSPWTSLPLATQEIRCRESTRWIDTMFEQRMKGTKLNNVQSLAFPRVQVYDYSGFLLPHTPLPKQLTDAFAIMAYEAATGAALLPTLAAGNRGLERKTTKTGDLLVTKVWGSGHNPQLDTYTLAEGVLAELLHPAQGGMVLRG